AAFGATGSAPFAAMLANRFGILASPTGLSAAFEVGYESASQFNREYKRFFGATPMLDIKAHRFAGSAAAGD
ncbi:MAG TPA: hypothetical protein VIX19_13110, partial [Terriglobales bacterium]